VLFLAQLAGVDLSLGQQLMVAYSRHPRWYWHSGRASASIPSSLWCSQASA